MYQNKPNMNRYKLQEVNELYPINDLKYMHRNHPMKIEEKICQFEYERIFTSSIISSSASSS